MDMLRRASEAVNYAEGVADAVLALGDHDAIHKANGTAILGLATGIYLRKVNLSEDLMPIMLKTICASIMAGYADD